MKYWNLRRDALERGCFPSGHNSYYDSLRSLELAGWHFLDDCIVERWFVEYDETHVRAGVMALMVAAGGNFVDVLQEDLPTPNTVTIVGTAAS